MKCKLFCVGVAACIMSFGMLSPGSRIYAAGMLGDLDNSASVNASDAAVLLQYAAYAGAGGTQSLPVWAGCATATAEAADLDENGDINAADAALILEYAAYAGGGGGQSLTSWLGREETPPETIATETTVTTFYTPETTTTTETTTMPQTTTTLQTTTTTTQRPVDPDQLNEDGSYKYYYLLPNYDNGDIQKIPASRRIEVYVGTESTPRMVTIPDAIGNGYNYYASSSSKEDGTFGWTVNVNGWILTDDGFARMP